ncbi:MAG TPA: cytochrome c family protein [Ignavibacteria bacterium]|nr:cytochrome c family protein [Ignavibacteria bacterium]
MKKKILIVFIFIAAITAVTLKVTEDAYTEDAYSNAPFKYVGVTTCVGACHKSESQGNQYEIWQNSKHSQAFKTLQTPEADKLAKEKGFTTPAAETPQCVKCHVLGKDIDMSELESTFNKEDGVQCETCHGPGSDYKKLNIMKDRAKSEANGLIIHKEKEAFCTNCHNPESPSYKEFNYDQFWAQIKHPKPKE